VGAYSSGHTFLTQTRGPRVPPEYIFIVWSLGRNDAQEKNGGQKDKEGHHESGNLDTSRALPPER